MLVLFDLHAGVVVYLNCNPQKHNPIDQDRLGHSNVMVINNMNSLVVSETKALFLFTLHASGEGMERVIFRARQTRIQILAPLGSQSRRRYPCYTI